MKKKLATLAVILAGCVPLQSHTVGKQQEIVVYPKFQKDTQAIIPGNTLDSIATLDIVPYVETTPGVYAPISSVTGDPTVIGAVDLLRLSLASPSIDPSRPFVIRRLKPNKNYRVYGRAYNVSNGQISQDLTSYVDVAVGSNDAPSMATLPVNLLATPFAAKAIVALTTAGRYDYLDSTLYLLSGNAQVAVARTTRLYPNLTFTNLQANTNYKLVAEARKFGTLFASSSITFNVGQDDAPATYSIALTIPYVVSTIAGSGSASFGDGPALSAGLRNPWGIAYDQQGSLYFTDRGNNCIRRLGADGNVTMIAGNVTAGFQDGTGAAALMREPVGITIDAQGNLYFTDYSNHCVRKLTPNGVVTTIAGNGTAGFTNGVGSQAQFRNPYDLNMDPQGNLIVADQLNHAIRRVTMSGVVTTIAGNGTIGATNGNGMNATFKQPVGVVADSQGNIFVADWVNCLVRKITPAGDVTTFAGNGTNASIDGTGTAAGIAQAVCLTIDPQDNLYVVEHGGQVVRRITPNAVVSTIAGSGSSSFADGTGTSAMFSGPMGIEMDSFGNLYLCDYYNHRLRKLQ